MKNRTRVHCPLERRIEREHVLAAHDANPMNAAALIPLTLDLQAIRADRQLDIPERRAPKLDSIDAH